MARTILRQPFSVSTSSSNYPKEQVFSHIEFKGLSDGKNDIASSASTFVDAKNVYVDENNLLVSRAPFILQESVNHILHQWTFGEYIFRYSREIVDENSQKKYRFKIECVSHTVQADFPYIEFNVDYDDNLGDEVATPVTVTQIEDKIFFWLGDKGDKSFVAFDTTGDMPRFEDGQKYLYIPLTKIITNGFDSKYEDENFVTDAHKERRLLSVVSSVNFDALIGKNFEVNMTSEDGKVQYLYDIVAGKNQAKTILYPFTVIGDNYYIDIVQTPRAMVIMRYGKVTKTIEVSFDGKFFNALPYANGIIGNPVLTRDGLGVVAFTDKALLKCKLVAQESSDFADEGFSYSWVSHPYFEYAIEDGKSVRADKMVNTLATGYFNTLDQFAYLIHYDDIDYVYAEWLGKRPIGARRDVSSYTRHRSNSIMSMTAKYYEPTLSTADGMIVVIAIDTYTVSNKDEHGTNLCIIFENTSTFDDVRIYNGDKISVPDLISGQNIFYIYKLTSDLKNIVTEHVPIASGDSVILMDYAETTPWSHTLSFANIGNLSRASTAREEFLVHRDDRRYRITDLSGNINIELGDTVKFQMITTELFFTGYDRGAIYGVTDESKLATFFSYKNADATVVQFLNPNASELRQSVKPSASIEKKLELSFTSGDAAYPYKPFFVPFPLAPDNIWTKSDTVGAAQTYIGSIITNIDGFYFALKNAYNVARNYAAGDLAYDIISQTDVTYLPQSSGASFEYINLRYANGSTTSFVFNQNGDVALYDSLYIDDEWIMLPKQGIPLSFSESGIWYLIGNTLWTSQLQNDIIINLDEYINTENKTPKYNGRIPIHHQTLDEHYFSFNHNGKHLLEISATRRDETDDRNFLLYLPRNNEQVFSQPITNLQPISDSTMGIFTENDVWYMSSTILNENLVYTKPVKSKIPLGCRMGDEIIIALDGQAMIIPTKRGIAAMTPEALMSDTEQTLTYLSDIIYDKYSHFYNDDVLNAKITYEPNIKIVAYNYWIMFYKYMSRDILVLDTRTSSWWMLDTPYPIMQIDSAKRLTVIMRVDPKSTSQPSNLGMPFVFADEEMRAVFKYGEFPELDEEPIVYRDSVLPDTLNGDFVEKYENATVGTRKIYQVATPDINWHFTSQRLHFGQINNYKKIKSISLNLKGTNTTKAKLFTKIFRDLYHPEQSDILEMKVNDIRTFTEYLNLMHVIDFQYKLENDTVITPSQFRLNAINVKYEVKEKIR